MFVYNITTKVDHSILNDWKQWQREIHIPEILATGCFLHHRFYELLDQDERDRTFVIQLFANIRNDYEKYLAQFAGELRNKSHEKWGDSVISFRSLLQEL
jgi:hypothetical protein